MRTARRVLLILMLVGVLVAAAAAYYVRSWLDTPLTIDAAGAEIEIQRGQTLTVVARDLQSRGLLRHGRLLALYGSLTGADERLRAGEYAIPPGTTPRKLLDLFVRGAVVQHSLTLVEGWTIRDVRRALDAAPKLVHTLQGKSDAEVMAALGEPALHPEGQFFPDTYLYGKGMRDVDLLRQAHERMRKELAAAWQARKPDLPFNNPYHGLVLASIVERETAKKDERPRIAGVFVERLRRGMLLQTDPAVIYGLGEKFDGNLRRADLERDGPYNTYTRTGLPPTPIAMPGAAALHAAMQPEERGELFFVATGLGDGSHAFSKTLSEHEAAVKAYLVRYRQQAGQGKK
jgi:UPF0755 protein